MEVFFMLLVALVFNCSQVEAQKNKEADKFDEQLWNFSTNFLLQYHSQWPLRRVVIVYHPEPGKEEYIFSLVIKLFQRLSKYGVSSSFIRIPDINAVAGLRLTEPNQPPINCILMLTPNEETSGFVRAAADLGGTTGDAVTWFHFRYSAQRNLTQEVGLRPDTEALMVIVERELFKITRWNGFLFKDKTAWDGLNRIPNDAAEQLSLDLSGQKLSVAVFHDPPFVYAENVSSNSAIGENQISGWMVDLWKDLQSVLKFSTTYYKPTRLDPNLGNFKRAVEEVTSGRADVVLSPFVVTASDYGKAEFTMPVTDLRFRFLLPRVTASSSIDQFVQPFQLLLWRVTAGTLTLAVIIITIAYTLGRIYSFEEQGTPLFNLKESITIIYGSLLAQGPDFTPNGLAARMVLWMSFAFGVVVSQAYSAALISKLTVGALEPPFRTIEGMLASGFTPLYLPDSAPQRLVMSADVGAWKEMRDRKPYPKVMRLTEGVNEVVNSWTLSTLLESRERILPAIQASPINCKVTLMPTDILKASAQFMLAKSSPYKTAIDQQLISMKASGRLARVRSSWMGLNFEDPCPKDGTLAQFGMENVILPFAILGGGLLFAIMLLMIEYAVKKWLGRLMAQEDEGSALENIARTQGIRLTKGWQMVQDKLPIVNLAEDDKPTSEKTESQPEPPKTSI